MDFLGADFETAKQALTVNNFNLEQAINYHLERSNSLGAPEDDVAGMVDRFEREISATNGILLKQTVWFFLEIFSSVDINRCKLAHRQ